MFPELTDTRATEGPAAPGAPTRLRDLCRGRLSSSQDGRRGAFPVDCAALASPAYPRIVVYRPEAGFVHAAGKADVAAVVGHLSPRYLQGLQTVELRPRPKTRSAGTLLFSEALSRGAVVLYAQPRSPWFLTGQLGDEEQRRLERAGAHVNADRRSCLVLVEWPGETLRDFMLYDVLCSAIARHSRQVRRGLAHVEAGTDAGAALAL